MKKLFLLVLCVILAGAFLVGCTGADDGGDGEVTTETGDSFTIGISQFAPHPALDNTRDGFIAGLAEEGFVEGENVTFITENAQADMGAAQQIAQNFVAQKVDMIYAIATPSAQAAQNAVLDTDIPVVFGAISDPVSANLSNEDGTGIGNITGMSDALPVDPQLAMIREMLPEAKTIGIIYNTGEDNSVATVAEIKDAAPGHGFTVEEVGVTATTEVPAAVDAMLDKNVDTIYITTDNTVVTMLTDLLNKTDEANIPVFGSEIEQVKLGAVATEGIEYFALGKQAGKMAAQILKGEKGADEIPFVAFADFNPYVNTAAAEAIGLDVPSAIIDRALEVFTSIDR
ncbi:MAG: ABC transporter substrate-binding protein [Coriobacteriia bacterium]|nr:ABC transporter substrate-binding protein [Coriobacteriia bacterium]